MTEPTCARSSEIAGLLLTQLNTFVRPSKLGRAYPRTAYRCFSSREVRAPDVSFVRAGRFTNDRSRKATSTSCRT